MTISIDHVKLDPNFDFADHLQQTAEFPFAKLTGWYSPTSEISKQCSVAGVAALQSTIATAAAAPYW